MQRFHDGERIVADLHDGITRVLQAHGISDTYDILAVAAVLQAIGSELKFQIGANPNPLAPKLGGTGWEALMASRLPMQVALLQSPHSLIVNPMMEAVAAALRDRGKPTSEAVLLRRSVAIQRERENRQGGEVSGGPTLASAFRSALAYLAEGGVIRRAGPGGPWELSEDWT